MRWESPPNFEVSGRTPVCDHSNTSYWAEFSCGTAYHDVGSTPVLSCCDRHNSAGNETTEYDHSNGSNMALFIVLRKHSKLWSLRTKPQCVPIQIQATEQRFHVVGSTALLLLLERNHSVWSFKWKYYSTVYCFEEALQTMKFVSETPAWPFKWMLMSSCFLSVTSFYGNNERVLFFFSKNAHANATFRYLKENYQPDITKRVVCERNTILCDHSNGSYWLQCCFAFDDCTKRYFWSVLRLRVQPFKTFHSFRVNQRKPKALRTYKECQAQVLISTSFSDIWHVISSVTSGYIHK